MVRGSGWVVVGGARVGRWVVKSSVGGESGLCVCQGFEFMKGEVILEAWLGAICKERMHIFYGPELIYEDLMFIFSISKLIHSSLSDD
jgi:hypothetical protein